MSYTPYKELIVQQRQQLKSTIADLKLYGSDQIFLEFVNICSCSSKSEAGETIRKHMLGYIKEYILSDKTDEKNQYYQMFVSNRDTTGDPLHALVSIIHDSLNDHGNLVHDRSYMAEPVDDEARQILQDVVECLEGPL